MNGSRHQIRTQILPLLDLRPFSLAFDVDSERNDWRGLGKNVPEWEEFTAIDDDPDSEGYFSSLGAYSIWTQGSIAGPRHPTSSDGTFSFVTKVELYIQIAPYHLAKWYGAICNNLR